jgi:hypothetical protein
LAFWWRVQVRDRQSRSISIWLTLILTAAMFLGAPPAWAANLREVAPPSVISQLAAAANSTPQVYIVSPRSDEVLPNGNVNVNLQVTGLTVFKNAALGLGPHLHLLLDGSPHKSIYDLSQPITLTDLAPGTHTLQLLATKPWNESWKNPGAFAQVTFHVLAKSIDSPSPNTPRLIYSPPSSIGAEPFLLDFQITNPPSHSDPQHPQRYINDWRVRVTINNQSFDVDRWQPYYLQGLNPGANLIKLEYLDKTGQVLDSSIRIVSYQPNGQDGSARLLRNEVPLGSAIALFDPNSRAITTVPVKAPVATAPPSPPPATIPVAPAQPVAIDPATPISPEPVKTIPANTPEPVSSSSPVPAMPVQTPRSPDPIPTSPLVPAPVATIPSPLPSPTAPAIEPVVPANPVPNPPKSVELPTESPVAISPTPPVASNPQPVQPMPNASMAPVNIKPSPNPVKSVAAQPQAPEVSSQPAPAPNNVSPTASTNTITSKPAPSIALAPNPSIVTPQNGEEVVEFKVILRELFHTLGVRTKQATNKIPPLVSQWSKNFGHWVTERMQAMRAPAPTPTPNLVDSQKAAG